ncbi:MAG TPA: FtsX-like permease family protein, partial [Candidatus Dormibacteraeota bacterium]
MPVVAVPPLVAALRWRAGASAALLVVAVLAVFTAASGPLFLATADTEVMHAQLEAAGPDQTVITAANPIPAFNSLRSIRGVSKVAHQSGLTNWYGRPTITQDVGFSRFKGNFGDLVSRTGVCGHLQFVSGHCPNGLFQVAITTRDASRLRAKIGSLLAVPGVDQFKVSGIIKVGNLANPYWLGDDFFDYSPQEIHKPPTLDAFFASAATLARLKSLVTIQYPIQVARTGPETPSPLRHAESRFAYVMRNTFRLTVSTRLGSALSSYQAQANAVAAIVGVVALQLLLLTLFVLYVLVARTAMARRSEVALAKLRGASLVSLLVMGVAEPTVILLIALPVGFVGAYLAMQVASRVALDGAPVPVTALALVAALAAFASGVVATFAGSRRLLTRQLIDELRSTEDKPSPVARAAWEGAALALAAAGLLELGTAGVLTGSHPNPIALFAPGLIALGIAVPGTRLLPLACAYLVRRTRHSPHVASGLAVRQVIRRPAALRQILILTVAVGLSAFAVIGWSVAGTNRTLRAEFDVGAAQVVKVKVPPSVNLVNAVRQADPSGRYAMAVMESRQPSADLIAMDPTRMARVPYWSDSVSPAELARLARWLQPKVTPPLILTGDQVRVTADLSATAYPPPDLVVNMLDSGGNAQEADFGYLTPGSHTYVAALPSACTGGCRVQSLTPIWFPSATGPPQVLYTLAISGLADHQRGSWQALDQRVYQSGYWATSSGAIKVSGASQTLTLVVHDTVSQDQPPSVLAAPLPKTLHGVATVASQPNAPVHNAIEDFD